MTIEEAYYQLLKDLPYEVSSLDKLDAFLTPTQTRKIGRSCSSRGIHGKH